MKKLFISIFFLCSSVPSLVGQDFSKFEEEQEDLYYSYRREVGLDFTPLISKLIPFNLGQTEFGLVGLKWKKYYYDKAFRMNLGATLKDFDEEENFLYLSIGYEKRKDLVKNWSYTYGWDIFAQVENSTIDDRSGIGVGPFWGFEYNINNKFFISTEAQLKLASINGELEIEFVVPNAIFLNVRL